MINILSQISKYLLLFFMAVCTIDTLAVLRTRDLDRRRRLLSQQVRYIVAFDVVSFLIMYLKTMDVMMLALFFGTLVYLLVTMNLYKLIYRRSSRLLLNTMCLMISIGMVIQSRLDVDTALRQLIIVFASTMICFLVPTFIRRAKWVSHATWLYGIAGILLLAVVYVFGRATGGANLSLSFHGFTFQFSEFVKITIVMFMAGILQKRQDFAAVVVVTVVAAIHVGILVLSTDLGAALLYFMAYIIMVFVATRNPAYAFIGLGGMAGASAVAYRLFSHIRVRFAVWKDPFADYEGTGYQIVQALFAVCAGGWFGTGLFNGSPESIPVVTKDFTFAAICEEFGLLFAICLILLCMGMYILIINISMKLDKPFYKLVAMGLGTEYAFQVFLTIGGTTKFIPMTGITLPLISYGGSSILCTIIMISIIQGLYIMRTDEDDEIERERIEEEIREERRLERLRQRDYEEAARPYGRKERRPYGGSDRAGDRRPGRSSYGRKAGVETDELGKKIEEQTKQSINY